MDNIGADFLQNIDVSRFSAKTKRLELTLTFRRETSEILCKFQKSGKVESYISLYDLKEIRPGKNSKDFEKFASDVKKIDVGRCFVVFYGTDFRLKTLSVAAATKKDADAWIKGLEYACEKKPSSYLTVMDIWIFKEFESIKTSNNRFTLKHMKDVTNRINYKISTGKLQDKFQQYSKDGAIGFEDFSTIVRDLIHDRQIFTDCFGKYALGDKIDLKGFKEFLKFEQKETKIDKYFLYFREFVHAGAQGTAYMNVYEAVDYLFCKQNQVWNDEYGKEFQDMTRPLSDYWINSSHNTYLTGDQVSSESSIEAYARCLRLGCRCIELDCWDGPNGIPEIYHGRTLTTKISFLDVIKTIKEHAFVTSEYPVILSVENHCSVKQQRVMAKKFQEVFGRLLVTHQINKDEQRLPSPEQLKRRILIKGKRLPAGCKNGIVTPENSETESETEGDTDSEKALDLCDTFKNGKMYIQGPTQEWDPYFFALTNEKLMYTEIDESKGKELERHQSGYANLSEDLHFSKKWFHGKILGGVKTAEERVKMFDKEGGFLVRMSETFPGEFALCFLSQGRAHHIRIKTDAQQTKFYLVNSKQFDNLYSLITYYRKNPLETKDFSIERFTEPVPQPESHEIQPWFYPNPKYNEPMNRKGAEEILQKIPLNGAFLVRYSSRDSAVGRFVISFRIENQIKHCRIKEEGRLLLVVNQKFESIEKLVSFFATKSFYKGVRLKHPVVEELLKFSQSVENPEKVYTSPDYLNTDILANKIRVQAIIPYHPTDPDNLYFDKDDIITNVIKLDGGWWKGDIEEKRQEQKYFPANFVVEIDALDSPFGTLQKGTFSIGKTEIEKNDDPNFPVILSIKNSSGPVPFRAAVTSMKEAKEWQEAINYVNTREKNKLKRDNMIAKKNKLSLELSKLVVYFSAVGKVPHEVVRGRGRIFYEMTSYSEVAGEKTMSVDPVFYDWLHEMQTSRIYPKGQRVDSSNYNPIRFWNFGCQMVALNFQTGDKAMQLNHGKFRQNGECGYVLRPDFMFKRNFDPTKLKDLESNEITPLTFTITIIAARHLARQGSNKGRVTDPYVEVEIIGADFDCRKVRTVKNIPDNGLNPFWNEKFTLVVKNPDLALIRFAVNDDDSFGDSHFLGQATYPARQLLTGYRSVPLENGFAESLLSSLLIHLTYS